MKTKKCAKLFFICTFALIMSVISASAVFAEEPSPGSDPAVIPVELGKQNQEDFLTNEPNQEVIFSYTAKSSKMVYFNFRSSHPSKMVLTDGDGNIIQTKDPGVSLQKNQWAPEGSTLKLLKDQELTRTKTVWSASFSSIPRTLDLNDHR